MTKEEMIINLRNLAIECKENYDKEEWLEKFIYTVCEQIIEPLQEKIKDLDWYKMWHKKFKKEIEDLTLELETYRPTKLHGNGQCKCPNCGNVNWTDFGFSRYKGQTLCDKCLKEVMQKEAKKEKELQAEVDKCWREVGKMCMEERKQVATEILKFAEEHSIGANIILKTFIKEEYGVEL